MKRASRASRTGEEQIAVSDFKARCLEIFETLRRSGRDLVVTKHGEPIARVVPIAARKPLRGLFAGQVEIRGDIVSSDFSDEWEANR